MVMDYRRPRAHGGEFRELYALDWVPYAAHLKRLDPEDRASRFHTAVSDARLTQHARAAMTGRARVLGWFEGGCLRAAAERHLSVDGVTAEAAFEVERDWRNRGVGSALLDRTVLWARNRGARRLVIQTSRRNLPMMRAAQKMGAAFLFDLDDAEGVIAPPRPTLASHMAEGAQAVEDRLRWLGRRILVS